MSKEQTPKLVKINALCWICKDPLDGYEKGEKILLEVGWKCTHDECYPYEALAQLEEV